MADIKKFIDTIEAGNNMHSVIMMKGDDVLFESYWAPYTAKTRQRQDEEDIFKYISDEDKLDKLLENQQLIKTPVVRNGKQVTVGYQPDVWKGWN